MKWLVKRLYSKEKGFTLIELLIVIIILAVLAAIAIPSYLSMRDRARESGTETEMANIATALEIYNADKGSYPATSFAAMKTALETAPAYMVSVPSNDKWGTAYVYTLSSGTYTLTSYGKDKASGGSDDIIWTNGQQTGMGAYN